MEYDGKRLNLFECCQCGNKKLNIQRVNISGRKPAYFIRCSKCKNVIGGEDFGSLDNVAKHWNYCVTNQNKRKKGI